jgi:SAM-dependent methyltransferase
MKDYQQEIRQTAQTFGVKSDIHPKDLMFQFYLKQDQDFQTGGIGVRSYFESGRESAQRIDDLIHRFAAPNQRRLNILEFASGYGCVTRHLEYSNHNHHTIACDIHPEAIEFLERVMGVEAILSEAVPEKFHPRHSFQVIFAISFFSHMPNMTWGRWLRTLVDLLSENGILIFTTHGEKIARTWRADKGISDYWGEIVFDESGYWFRPETEQHDLPTDEYGTTLVTPLYVTNRISEIKAASLLFFQEGFWWGGQDTYVVQKILR